MDAGLAAVFLVLVGLDRLLSIRHYRRAHGLLFPAHERDEGWHYHLPSNELLNPTSVKLARGSLSREPIVPASHVLPFLGAHALRLISFSFACSVFPGNFDNPSDLIYL